MARRRRPSIPLIILFIILILLFALAGVLVEIVSNWAAKGSFTFTYVQGEEAIVSITYTLPQDLADAMVPGQVVGWAINLAGNILSLTGGTLNPGESITINYRLAEYIPGGTKTVTVTTMTVSGSTSSTQSPLQVPDAILLNIVMLLYQNAIWFLILAIIVLVIIIVLYIRGEKKAKEDAENQPEPKEE